VAPRDPLQIAASPVPIEAEVEPADEPDAIDDADEDVGGEISQVSEVRSDGEQREGPDGQRRGRRRRRGRGRGEGRPEGGQRSEGGQRPEGNRAEGFRADASARNEPHVRRETEGEDDIVEAGAGGSNGAHNGHNGGERPFVAGELGPDGLPRKRRRGRRGGRRGRRGRGGEGGAPGEERPQEHNRQNGAGEQRPAMENRPPRADNPRPHDGNNFGGTISSDYEDIDTTPTLEARPAHQAPRRIDMRPPEDLLEGEIDTTPQPIERPAEVSSSEPADSTPRPASKPAAEPEAEAEDPNRPKRNGWWQRKSFF
jgi:ribonuclease E